MATDPGSISFGPTLRSLHAGVPLEGAPPSAAAFLRRNLHPGSPGDAYGRVRFHDHLPPTQTSSPHAAAESFVIEAGENVDVYAATERAAHFAAHALVRRASAGLLPAMRLEASPVCPVRGVKLLLPAADGLGDFKRFIDFLAARRFNTIMLEVGGAMEYRRHPEINEGWIAYCKEMRQFPGKASQVHRGCKWPKDSIHSDNGGGGVLPQAVVRELIDHCRQRFMEVIPEVPLLSHSDYLLTRHPELVERQEDPYPDTYCPSNPATYDLVFDVLHEVLDVFRPASLNIGHDEYYSIGLCPRCRGKPAPELFAGDIQRLHDFLAARDVRTQMWGEKLIEANFRNGLPLGGGAAHGVVPATYPAIDMIPRSVEILHWYWSIDRKYDESYLRRGMGVTFGNFDPIAFPEWSRRIAQDGVRGIMISNWGATDAVTLQRNGLLFQAALAARMCWDTRLGDADMDRLRLEVFDELYHGGYDEVAGAVSGIAPGATPGETPGVSGVPGVPGVPGVEIVHTTSDNREFDWLVDGNYYRPEDFQLGEYRIRFADAHEHRAPVIGGTHIGYEGVSWSRAEDKLYDMYNIDRRLLGVAGLALPWRDGDQTWYTTRIALPRPASAIRRIDFIPKAGFEGKVRVRGLRP